MLDRFRPSRRLLLPALLASLLALPAAAHADQTADTDPELVASGGGDVVTVTILGDPAPTATVRFGRRQVVVQASSGAADIASVVFRVPPRTVRMTLAKRQVAGTLSVGGERYVLVATSPTTLRVRGLAGVVAGVDNGTVAVYGLPPTAAVTVSMNGRVALRSTEARARAAQQVAVDVRQTSGRVVRAVLR
jgi:hypothetical protein